MDEKMGKVYLVGAGPSDPGLLTLRGKELLERAQVVVYDALIGDGILAMIPPDAEAINAGKRASHHTLPQEETSALLAKKAKEGKEVVRLKGGDPFLFGRGGEEIELLVKEGVPFEIVPGITSAFAVPAYQGIPVTHRDYSSSVHVITGHKRENMQYDIDFGALVKTGGTLIFLMGVAALPDICKGLMDAGMQKDTPAALLMNGTTASQRKILATVGTLEDEVKRQGGCTPAIIVIGGVCALSDAFSWYDMRPLSGVKVMLTRPRTQSNETAKRLRDLGAEVLEMPMIVTERIPDNEDLIRALDEIASYQWIVFTSRNGVRIFFEEMMSRKIDRRILSSAKFAVIGSGTKEELASYGFYADLMPEVYDAAHLGKELYKTCLKTDRILIARAKEGSPDLTRELPDLFVDDVPVYETKPTVHSPIDLQKEFADGTINYVIFTSSSTVRAFRDRMTNAGEDFDFSRVQSLCIGPQTASEAEKLGMSVIVAKRSSVDGLIECLLEERKQLVSG